MAKKWRNCVTLSNNDQTSKRSLQRNVWADKEKLILLDGVAAMQIHRPRSVCFWPPVCPCAKHRWLCLCTHGPTDYCAGLLKIHDNDVKHVHSLVHVNRITSNYQGPSEDLVLPKGKHGHHDDIVLPLSNLNITWQNILSTPNRGCFHLSGD